LGLGYSKVFILDFMPQHRIYGSLGDGYYLAAIKLAYLENPSNPELSKLLSNLLYRYIQENIQDGNISPVTEEDIERDRSFQDLPSRLDYVRDLFEAGEI
jgi:hypothetical protein